MFINNSKITGPGLIAIAGFLLFLMFFLAFFSMRGDSATMDELPHIPAGYSYLTQKDMRLNPEHPPLLKDLAGLSIWLGAKITKTRVNFPSQIKEWEKDINGQWDFGRHFLYQTSNDADKIIFWARLPMLLVMLILGFYVFWWPRQLYGPKAALLALFLYGFSPNFLAHSRYVTTDVGAAAAFFIAVYYFLKWLKQPNKKNLILSGAVLGLAFLTKFSLILLIPYFVFLTAVWILIKNPPAVSCRLVKKYCRWFLIMGLISLGLIWSVYQFHTFNYPPAKQQSDAAYILQSLHNKTLTDPIVWLADKPILRPLAQYLLGFLMVAQRTTGGNTTYFLGEVSNQGWKSYFPILYAIKVPLSIHLLTIISLLFLAWQIKKPWPRFQTWLKKYFIEFSMIIFIAFYWAVTLKSNLNIGLRHILPTFPFVYVLVSGQIIKIIDRLKIIKTGFILFLFIVLFWQAFSVIKVYPHFLAYFNELINGSKNGYQYVTDSNLDWGQNLKRLAEFTENPPVGGKINEIYVDYFGGGSPEYYLKNKFRPWWGQRSPQELPPNSWLAVSATLLQQGRAEPVSGFEMPTNYYAWLNQYEPTAIIGYSIFVYKIK